MDYTLLMGIGVSVAVVLIRWLSSKYNKEVTRTVTLAIVLVLSFISALVLRYAPEELIQEAVKVFSTSLVFYEVAVKSVVLPAFDKFMGNK